MPRRATVTRCRSYAQDTHCPHCGEPVNRAIELDARTAGPGPGDATVCDHCGRWAVYDADLNQRVPDDAEREKIQASPMWATIKWACRMAQIRIAKQEDGAE